MNTNSYNLEPEFDARLKAHLKTRGATTVCAGFDFDTASAYLEHTLQAKASTLYEEHLADCAACRNQVVELSRLMPAETVVAPAVVPVRGKWSEWFSGWKLGMLAGLGTATAAILLFTMVTVQRNSTPLAIAESKEVAAPSMAVPLANDDFITLKESQRVQDAAKTPIPAPSASVMASTPVVQGVAAKAAVPEMELAKKSVQIDGASMKDNVSPSAPGAVSETVTVTVENKEALQTLPQGQLQNTELRNRAMPTPTPHGPMLGQNQMQNNQMTPIEPSAKPMVGAVAKFEERQTEKMREKAKSTDAAKAERDDKAARLSAPAAASAVAGRAAKTAPQKNVAGKNFRSENGRWIDTQWNSGLAEIRLKRNSDEYKKVLKDTPELKPYFDLKSVIVVWQGKAYRVE